MRKDRPRRLVMRLSSLLTFAAFTVAMTTSGCFNTYYLEPEEFMKLQRAEEVPRTVVSKKGEQVVVERTTNLFVRSVGGRRYQVTPFNFKMTQSQLVASDRDTLLMLDEVKSYEVDHLSTPLTVLIIVAGVVVVGGLIAVAVACQKEEGAGSGPCE